MSRKTIESSRHEFTEESGREDEWSWYSTEDDWKVTVSDQGINRSGVFNVILGTDLYESRNQDGVILSDTRVEFDEVVGYERAMARAAELIANTDELVDEVDHE